MNSLRETTHHLDFDSPVALSCLGVHIPLPLSKVPQFDRFRNLGLVPHTSRLSVRPWGVLARGGDNGSGVALPPLRWRPSFISFLVHVHPVTTLLSFAVIVLSTTPLLVNIHLFIPLPLPLQPSSFGDQLCALLDPTRIQPSLGQRRRKLRESFQPGSPW